MLPQTRQRQITRTSLHWKWPTALVAVAALLLAGWALFAPVLRGLAGQLIADEPGHDFQYLAIIAWNYRPSGYRCYDTAAELYREKPSSGIVIVEPRRTRLVETGALPSFESLSRRELVSRGVAGEAISAIQSDGNDNWATGRAIQRWLAERPEATMVVPCAAFRSAQLRYALDTLLAPVDVARVRVRALVDPDCDAGNWWTSRDGIKTFGFGWLRMLHAWYVETGRVPPPCADADEYDRRLDISEQPRAAEYVLVLTGDEDTRPFAAAALLKAGLAQKALVVETPPPRRDADADLPPAHEVVRRVLLRRGVAPGDIEILPGAATTTYDEALALAAFVRQRPDAHVLIVTNGYHTRRSRWTTARALADRAGQVAFVAAPIDEFDVNQWWNYEAGFTAITAEYLKLAFYFVCYSGLGWWLVACGVLALVAIWARRRQAMGTVPIFVSAKMELSPLPRSTT